MARSRSRKVRPGRKGRKRSEKVQSAMEYLMTYGWAILLITTITGALYYTGSLSTLAAPKAQPGSCFVFRSSEGSSLQGLCQGEQPLTVASFGGPNSGGKGGGGPSCLNATAPRMNLNGKGYNTVNFWMYWNGTLNESPVGFPGYFMLLSSYGCAGFSTGNKDDYGVSANSLKGNWTMVTIDFFNGPYTMNGTLYLDGKTQSPFQCQGTAHTGFAKSNLLIGSSTGSRYLFTGSMSNIQLYNTSLSAPEAQALYSEGIGGAPIRLQNLVAWYPLNANTNDYSGYNGTATINACNSSYSGSYGTAP